MKAKYLLFGMLAALVCGCSSDDDNSDGTKTEDYTVTTVGEAPEWQIDWQAKEAYPDWKGPDIQNYENWGVMKMQIEESLKPYTSSDDRMALFVGDECRGISGPAIILDGSEKNTTTYLFKAWGNEVDGQQLSVTLKYYNALLKQVFAVNATITYRVGEDVGVGTDLIPHFTLGSSKYPVVMIFDATALLTKFSVTPAAGDLMAAFVGDECRGVSLQPAGITIYGRTEGESVTVKFYQAATGHIYTFPNVVKIVKE